jgi:hypothetical protein
MLSLSSIILHPITTITTQAHKGRRNKYLAGGDETIGMTTMTTITTR